MHGKKDPPFSKSVATPATLIETIDAIRALTGRERNAGASIANTNAALGIGKPFA